jgi:hypothetical protein
MKNINDMSMEELKALAYDTLSAIERGQNDLRVLNQAIANKQIQRKEIKDTANVVLQEKDGKKKK